MLNLFFAFLSAAYIAGIFFLADSPVVSSLSAFNPYSLLHIPLYGILALLLILTMTPFGLCGSLFSALRSPLMKRSDDPNLLNGLTVQHSLHIDASPHQRIYASARGRILISGFIAFLIGVADECYQSFIPSREASMTDVLLDGIGALLAVVLMLKLIKRQLPNDPLT
jgi:predicted membrane metal-binding protein